MLSPPQLVERDHSSVLIAWDGHDEAVSYELQVNTHHDCDRDEEWQTLSSSLKSTSVKKKNLTEGTPYRFRVRFVNQQQIWCSWSHSSEPFYPLGSNIQIMPAPEMVSHDGSSVTLRWVEVPQTLGYRVRFRDDNHLSTWSSISDMVKSSIMKKKGLENHVSYYFAVMPVFPVGHHSESSWAFSLSGGPFKTAILSPHLKQLLPPSILWKNPKENNAVQSISTSDALAGKHLAIYFSAHWCGPCRNFTPKLADLYHQIKTQGKNLEVIFCSADHDESGFNSYYASMPWMSIEYEDPKREEFMSLFKVSGIPRLCILSPSGRIIEDNAATRVLMMRDVDQWLQQIH